MAKPPKLQYTPQKLCVEILKGIRDTTIEEDLEKEMEKGSENQHKKHSLIYNCHPWGGCTTTGVFALRGEDKGRGAPNPGGIIANTNSFRREDVQKYFDEVTHVELPAKLVKGSQGRRTRVLQHAARVEDRENPRMLGHDRKTTHLDQMG